jgi:uncharacterized protein YraI
MQLKTRILVAASGFAAMMALPAMANAAAGAYATGNVNMRTCGSTSCPRITTVPAGAPVTIYGCTGGYGWCDTQYGGYRGWVSGSYLQAIAPGYASPSPLPAIGALIGIGIIGAAIANNRYYDNRYPYRYGYPYPGWRPGYRPPGWGGTPGWGGRPGWNGTPGWNGGGWNGPRVAPGTAR